jgi:hypothetical protein
VRIQLLELVVKHPRLADGGGKMACHLCHKVTMLAREREGDVEAARTRKICGHGICRKRSLDIESGPT